MVSIAIIACDHGFGHVKRGYHYGLQLAISGYRVSLLARKDGLSRFSDFLGHHENLNLIPFNTSTAINKSKEELVQWLQRLPDLSHFDFIVSDNLPEILSLYPQAILSGSFLWHLDAPTIDPAYSQFCQGLIETHQPIHLASEFFVSDQLMKYSNIIPIGLIGHSKDFDRLSPSSGALLISSGKNEIQNPDFKDLISELILYKERLPFTSVYVDSSLLPTSAPEWMIKATFDEEMYSRLSSAIIRPGVGTVTDCIRHRVLILATSENDNKEMQTNIEALERWNLGTRVDLSVGWLNLLEEIYGLDARYNQNLANIQFNAEDQVVNFFTKLSTADSEIEERI